MLAMTACSTRARTPTPVPTPTLPRIPYSIPYISALAEDEFLVLYIDDNDYTCLEERCSCAISEAPARPFQVKGDLLIINPYFFPPHPDDFVSPWQTTDWIQHRRSTGSIGLIGFYSQWNSTAELFTDFSSTGMLASSSDIPGPFEILGADAAGMIQGRTNGGYWLAAPRAAFVVEVPQEIDEHCKVLHIYTLTNYGFFKDENVRFE